MENIGLMYLLTVLFKVLEVNIVVGSICAVIFSTLIFITFFISTDYEEREDCLRAFKSPLKITAWVMVITTLIYLAIPDKKDSVLIVGGSAVISTGQYLSESEEAKKIPDNVLKAMNTFLEGLGEEE